MRPAPPLGRGAPDDETFIHHRAFHVAAGRLTSRADTHKSKPCRQDKAKDLFPGESPAVVRVLFRDETRFWAGREHHPSRAVGPFRSPRNELFENPPQQTTPAPIMFSTPPR